MPSSDLAPVIDWDVTFKFEELNQTIVLMVEHELLLGRTPNGKAEMPAADLSTYNAIDMGVSRRHGILTNQGENVSYTDLGSENGSVLNGQRMTPREPTRLQTGDILYLGHLKTQVTVKSRPRKTSIMAARPELSFDGAQVQGHGQRILVVEDDAGVADMYRLALERSGYTVQIAREMVSAIRALNHVTPNAIVLDVMLPGIRGLELARYVRRDTECPDIPIVVTSALTTPEAVKNGMDSGVDVYMGKPLDWRELSRVIGTLVQHSEAVNPMIHTKKLAGTARLNFIPATTRQDTIVMFFDTQREPLTAVVQPEVTLGRQNPGGTERYVDLESYNAFERGVSRIHVKIKRIGTEFEVEDLASANGTYINGFSIAPHKPHPLKNGDEVRMGDLRMHVYFLSETEVSER